MRRRLLRSTALIALAAVLLLGVPLGLVGGRLVRSVTSARLERDADAVAVALDDRIERHEAIDSAQLARLAPAGRRIVVRFPDGRMVRGGAVLHGEQLASYASSGGARVTALVSESQVDDGTDRVWLAVLGLSLAAVTVALGLSLAQSRRFARPLEQLAGRTARLGTPAFTPGAEPTGVPEVDQLGEAFDRAAGRITRLLAREREFSANASHQLRTPLTALRLELEELERIGRGDVEATEEVRDALVQADRLESVIVELEGLARDGAGRDAGVIDAAALVHEEARVWRGRYEEAGRELRVDAGRPLAALGSAGAARQALDALLANALRHGEGTVCVRVRTDRHAVDLDVSDEGPGVPAGRAAQVFERGISHGGSSGLGLAVARELLEASGGDLRLLDGRSTFRMTLPAADGSPDEAAPSSGPPT